VKLKTIFIIFNVLIGISFLFVFLMPGMFLGWEYAGVFWRENWYLILLFLAVFGLLNGYFSLNRRLFVALEREDWDAVISVLEKRVLEKHRFTTGNIRLLVNACVIRSRSDRIRAIENAIRQHRPRKLGSNALLLGIPHLLSNNGAEIVEYYGPFRDSISGRRGDWIRWSYAFGLMLQEKTSEAAETLRTLCTDGKDPVVRAVSAYLLEAYAGTDEGIRGTIDATRAALKTAHSPAEWERLVERQRSELYVLILSKLLQDVTEWLYKETS
jgi:hypothetical protein